VSSEVPPQVWANPFSTSSKRPSHMPCCPSLQRKPSRLDPASEAQKYQEVNTTIRSCVESVVGFGQLQIGAVEFKGVSLMVRAYTSGMDILLSCWHIHKPAPGLVSNHLLPSLKLRRRHSTMELRVLWLQEVVMTLVLCLVQFLLWRPWLLSLSWINFSFRIHGRQLPVFFLPSPRYQQQWSCQRQGFKMTKRRRTMAFRVYLESNQ